MLVSIPSPALQGKFPYLCCSISMIDHASAAQNLGPSAVHQTGETQRKGPENFNYSEEQCYGGIKQNR